ncbi:unnamed protein product [Adineta steineri]|uniref:Thioredoxin domain-containing protein n=1 Tax=Adineta steineri TaxID=433720 RepID=A0A819K6H8_9BILA|nr:unnamed protein product [Adineta steineri]CAF3944542.1 unnamed protein product [Adineta steineri]
MAAVAKLLNGHILDKSNRNIDLNNEKYQGKFIGLYFSAHWCPPCRNFTPVLVEFYKKYAEEKKFEIIFISSDNDDESFNEYYNDMPWLKLDFKERQIKEELDTKFEVDGIPSLILLDGNTGNVLCNDARQQIQFDDKQGNHFPWNNPQTKKSSRSCICC